MTASEWHKIKNDGDPWQPTCWLQMARNEWVNEFINGNLYCISLQNVLDVLAQFAYRSTDTISDRILKELDLSQEEM